MRILIVVATAAEAQAVYRTIENSTLVLEPQNLRKVLTLFRDNPDAVLIGPRSVLGEGYRIPHDALVLCGPGLREQDVAQAYARVGPPVTGRG